MLCWFFKKKRKNIEEKKVEEVKKDDLKQEPNVETTSDVKEDSNLELNKENNQEEQGVLSETYVEEEEKDVTNPVKKVKYHVSQNKDEDSEFFKKWRVRKEGSKKTIKFFDTQLEAIKYAESLAKNQDSSVVIHKVDGTIRKQDYSKN